LYFNKIIEIKPVQGLLHNKARRALNLITSGATGGIMKEPKSEP
jgi:hypothetical protein